MSGSRSGSYDYDIHLMLQGITLDPSEALRYEHLHELGLERERAGGVPLSRREVAGALVIPPAGNRFSPVFFAAKLVAYEPSSRRRMVALRDAAERAGLEGVVGWAESIIKRMPE